MSASLSRRRLRLTISARALLAVLLISPLASCGDFHRLSSDEAWIESNPTLGHPIQFIERHEVLDIELPPRQQGLSRNQHVDVYRFGVRYSEQATGPIVVSPPSKRYGDAHSPALAEVRRVLRQAGVPAERIAMGHPGRGPLVTLAYDRPLAVAPQCGHWPRDVGRERERVLHPDFGCATQRNLAGMVVNARDLMTAQAETPASSERRMRTWSKYVNGDAAGQQAAPQADGADQKRSAAKK